MQHIEKSGDNDKNTDRPRSVYIATYGCQMNTRDSEALAGLLQDAGYQMAESEVEADIILFNTCSVRQHAEDKVWSEAGRIFKVKSKKEKGKKPIIGIIGCMAQNYKQEIFKRAPYVDLVVGPNDLLSIPFLLKQVIKEKSNALAVSTMEREQDFYISPYRQGKDHAYVVISEGCDNFCSYCVVPYVRGRLHHRHQDDILNEIKKAVASGIKKITLLGQNINSYKLNGVNFVQLLKEVNSVEELKEFYFVTSHPKNATEELFLAMRDLEKCRKTLHLPIQSASDRILKMMNRGYTGTHYRKLADLYRKITKGKLSTDIIVGFPGETEEDFQETLSLVKEIEFDSAYLFKYSVRPHTEAQNLADDVPKEVKEKRHRILLDLQEEISRKKQSNGE